MSICPIDTKETGTTKASSHAPAQWREETICSPHEEETIPEGGQRANSLQPVSIHTRTYEQSLLCPCLLLPCPQSQGEQCKEQHNLKNKHQHYAVKIFPFSTTTAVSGYAKEYCEFVSSSLLSSSTVQYLACKTLSNLSPFVELRSLTEYLT